VNFSTMPKSTNRRMLVLTDALLALSAVAIRPAV
jgi:hypothetical protein